MRTPLQNLATKENSMIRDLHCMNSIAARCHWMPRQDQLIIYGAVAKALHNIKQEQLWRKLERKEAKNALRIR